MLPVTDMSFHTHSHTALWVTDRLHLSNKDLFTKCFDSLAVMEKVKMEQDMAMRQAEEEAMRHHQFKANPLPKSTTEPR